MSVLRILQKLKGTAQRRPLLFNSVIYGSFYTGAEFTRQTYSRMFKFPLVPVSEDNVELNTIENKKPLFIWTNKFNETLGLLDENKSTELRDYNWPQLKRYAIYGCFIAGPVLHGWYHALF